MTEIIFGDEQFADELIRRLNKLCEDKAARAAVIALLDAKVDVGTSLDGHPSCQVSMDSRMGPLGMLNGLTGVVARGRRAGDGLICASYKNSICAGDFMGFFRTDDCEDTEALPTQNPSKEYDE